MDKISIFWFRRDLRLNDNHGLYEALKGPYPVLPVFIFDEEITDQLAENDPRISFIYNSLKSISTSLLKYSSGVLCKKGDPIAVWKTLIKEFNIHSVYTNEDYEPYAINRDANIERLLTEKGTSFNRFKDQVIFAKNDVLKNDGTPYTVFTPYKTKWLQTLNSQKINRYNSSGLTNYFKFKSNFPSLSSLKFIESNIEVRNLSINNLDNYLSARDYPSLEGTSNLGPHLRFGTISIREILLEKIKNETFVSELIWREFFMQILFHFPHVIKHNFKRKYDFIEWRNNSEEFEKWKNGKTGYPFVDAGMRELNKTGYMHNRVRMIAAGFLCKHLLIDWRWGEAYFANKLLDYELSSNNGNWQWSAGTGCDSAPYFRIFNPAEQIKKFDSKLTYIKKWIPELDSFNYPNPMVDHKFARERALKTYKIGLDKYLL